MEHMGYSKPWISKTSKYQKNQMNLYFWIFSPPKTSPNLQPTTKVILGVSLNGGTPHFTPQNDHF